MPVSSVVGTATSFEALRPCASLCSAVFMRQDAITLRESKRRVEHLLRYYRDSAGAPHAFVALLETQLAAICDQLAQAGETERRSSERPRRASWGVTPCTSLGSC